MKTSWVGWAGGWGAGGEILPHPAKPRFKSTVSMRPIFGQYPLDIYLYDFQVISMVSDKLVDKALHKQKSDKSVFARFAAYGLL